MPTPRGSWYLIDLSIKEDEADLADNDVVVVGGICPWAGEVKEVWVGLSILPTTGTLAVYKSNQVSGTAGTPVTLLSAATTDLSSATVYTVHTASKMTLTTSTESLQVAAGDILYATWTLTDITVAGADDLFLCTVIVEPKVW
jgi:hypothetical protein